MKLVWHVASAPSGRWRSFERRGWPSAKDTQGRPIAFITCNDPYVPRLVRTGEHGELTMYVAQYSNKERGFDWRRMKAHAATLDEAKALVQKFVDSKPDFFEQKGKS